MSKTLTNIDAKLVRRGACYVSKQDSLETIWEVPDDLWEEIEPLISPNPPRDGLGDSP